MIIRTAKFNDVSKLTVHAYKLNEHYSNLGVTKGLFMPSPAHIAEKISDYIVAEVNGEVVASIKCSVKDRICTLSRLYVEEPFRGQRIGTSLMSYAIGKYKARGCKDIRLVVRNLNGSVKKLYEKLGFVNEATVMYYDK